MKGQLPFVSETNTFGFFDRRKKKSKRPVRYFRTHEEGRKFVKKQGGTLFALSCKSSIHKRGWHYMVKGGKQIDYYMKKKLKEVV